MERFCCSQQNPVYYDLITIDSPGWLNDGAELLQGDEGTRERGQRARVCVCVSKSLNELHCCYINP